LISHLHARNDQKNLNKGNSAKLLEFKLKTTACIELGKKHARKTGTD
jgi:hypothetical protein